MINKESPLKKVKAWNFLQDHPVGTITSLNTDTIPESSAVYFFAKSDFTCFFVTKVLTRKYQNFLKCQNATLLTFDEKELISVEVQGQVETVVDVLKVVKIIEEFQELTSGRKSEYWIPPISQIEAGQYVVCKLIPTAVHYNKFPLESDDLTPERLTFTFRQ